MGLYYSVIGEIPADLRRPGIAETLAEMHDRGWSEPELSLNAGENNDEQVLSVRVGGHMSYSSAAELDDWLVAFARLYATAPTSLYTECEGGRGKLYVGPPGFDEIKMMIADADLEIIQLIQRRNFLFEQWVTRVPD